MNRCIIEGEIIREPEIKNIKSAKGEYKLLTFTVAVPRVKKEGLDYFRCNVWGGLVAKYDGKLSKGQKVHVVGSIAASAYIKDDKAKSSLDLTVEEVGDLPTQQGFVEVDPPDDLPF